MKILILTFCFSLFTCISFAQLMSSKEEAREKMNKKDYQYHDSQTLDDGYLYERYTYVGQLDYPPYVTLCYHTDKKCHVFTWQGGDYYVLKKIMKDVAEVFDLKEFKEDAWGNSKTDVYELLQSQENNGWTLTLIQK